MTPATLPIPALQQQEGTEDSTGFGNGCRTPRQLRARSLASTTVSTGTLGQAIATTRSCRHGFRRSHAMERRQLCLNAATLTSAQPGCAAHPRSCYAHPWKVCYPSCLAVPQHGTTEALPMVSPRVGHVGGAGLPFDFCSRHIPVLQL